MRPLIGVTALSLLLILLIGLFCGTGSKIITEKYLLAVEEIQALIEMERWEESLSRIRTAELGWEKSGRILSLWAHHGDIDEVSAGFLRLQLAAESREKYQALLFAGEISHALSHITLRDAFSLKNIL